jgi:hypothetical protein
MALHFHFYHKKIMAHKENKGGVLTNEQIEQDLKINNKDQQQGNYRGMQDTGDKKPREGQLNEEAKKQDKEDEK